MSRRTSLVDEVSDLVEGMTQDQISELLQRIPGVQSRVFKKSVRFMYSVPRHKMARRQRHRRVSASRGVPDVMGS